MQTPPSAAENKRRILGKKIAGNMERDAAVNNYYHAAGWNILRIWEHDLRSKHFNDTIDLMYSFAVEAKKRARSK